jgi:hypothetical protein
VVHRTDATGSVPRRGRPHPAASLVRVVPVRVELPRDDRSDPA